MTIKINERFDFGDRDYKLDHGKYAGYFARGYRAKDLERESWVVIKLLRHLVGEQDEGKIKEIPPSEMHFNAFSKEAFFLNKLGKEISGNNRIARIPKLSSQGFVTGLENDVPVGGEIEEVDNTDEYQEQMLDRMKDGWRPYLILEYFPKEKNVLTIQSFYNDLNKRLIERQNINHSITPSAHLPILHVLLFALQVARLFKHIHNNKSENGPILYPDSRLTHFFWNGQQAAVIDWNRVWFSNDEDRPPNASEKTDIKRFVAVPLYALLTGKKSAGVQEFFGPESSRPKTNGIIQNVELLKQKGIEKLFIDTLRKGVINNAEDLEKRSEELLLDMFGFSENKKNQNAAFIILDEIINDTEALSTRIAEMAVELQSLYFAYCPDADYLSSLIDYIREHRIFPWENTDPHSNF